MESVITAIIFLLLVIAIAVPYWRKVTRVQNEARLKHEKVTKAGLAEPVTLHPRIDILTCIGCSSCVKACPEHVLGIVQGKAAIINGMKCVGHALCVSACPVGAIEMGFGKPRQGMEIPYYDQNYATNVNGLYIVGELGGVGLIKNAIEQSIKAVTHIAQQLQPRQQSGLDVAIIGAGPAGLGAALTAKANGLRYVVLEQYDLGGSVLHYPRKKVVLTSPVEIPLYGKLKATEISKEELLQLFKTLVDKFGLHIRTQQLVREVTKSNSSFHIRTDSVSYEAAKVIFALGRRGTPKKLGVPGEELSKVYYKLIEAESYTNQHILVVGGGDSAIEAAVGLARQKGNTVTLSYRRDAFVRLKEKNETHIHEMMKSRKVRVIFESEVSEIRQQEVLVREKSGSVHQIRNDVVFIFAGGEMPAEFLKKVGVELRTEEMA